MGNLVSFFFECFLPFTFTPSPAALQSSKPAKQKNVSQACNLFPTHFIQPIRCFIDDSLCQACVPKAAVAGVGFQSKLKAQISSRNMHKYKKKTFKGENVKTFLCFQFSDGFFKFLLNFRKSEFGGFKKQEIKLFWTNKTLTLCRKCLCFKLSTSNH